MAALPRRPCNTSYAHETDGSLESPPEESQETKSRMITGLLLADVLQICYTTTKHGFFTRRCAACRSECGHGIPGRYRLRRRAFRDARPGRARDARAALRPAGARARHGHDRRARSGASRIRSSPRWRRRSSGARPRPASPRFSATRRPRPSARSTTSTCCSTGSVDGMIFISCEMTNMQRRARPLREARRRGRPDRVRQRRAQQPRRSFGRRRRGVRRRVRDTASDRPRPRSDRVRRRARATTCRRS